MGGDAQKSKKMEEEAMEEGKAMAQEVKKQATVSTAGVAGEREATRQQQIDEMVGMDREMTGKQATEYCGLVLLGPLLLYDEHLLCSD